MQKSEKIAVIAGFGTAALLAGGLAVSLVMNFRMNSTLRDVKNLALSLKTEASEEKEEDRLLIGGEYEIRDYSRISDAYISGDSSKLTDGVDKEILQLASDLLDEIITDDMSDYEKELAVHDWLAENVSFDGSSLMAIPAASQYCDSPYGALKYKNAVCVGYATTFKLLVNMLGMECEVIHDTDFSHSWDVVKLDDGEYYLVDVTFDAGENGSFSHVNFNLDENSFSMSHDWNINDYPRAFGTKYNYAVMNCQEIADIYKLPETIHDAMENDETELYFTVKDASDETVMAAVALISDACMMNSDRYIDYNAVYSDEKTVFALAISGDYDEDYSEMLGDVDEEKLYSLIEEYFGETDYGYGDMPWGFF